MYIYTRSDMTQVVLDGGWMELTSDLSVDNSLFFSNL